MNRQEQEAAQPIETYNPEASTPWVRRGRVEAPTSSDDDIDREPRYAPNWTRIVKRGVDHGTVVVKRWVAHPPGAHPKGCPLVPTCVALELVTEHGSAWWGFEQAYINSELRMIVAGFPARDELRRAWRKCTTP